MIMFGYRSYTRELKMKKIALKFKASCKALDRLMINLACKDTSTKLYYERIQADKHNGIGF
jgi:hypothetical protein